MCIQIWALVLIKKKFLYKHYQDCYDLLDKIEEEGLHEFEKMPASIEASGTQAALTAILNTLRNNSRLIQALGDPVSNQRFINRLAGCCFLYMEQWLGPISGTNQSEVRRDVRFAFLAGGSSSVIEWWLRRGMKEAPEEMASWISALSESVVNGLPN